MKPDWDKLGNKYADNPNVMIVDVDCTAAGQGTCQKVGVKGYPTIKYYLPNEKKGRDYQGGRDFAALSSFVEQKLNKATCDAVTKKGCAKNEVAFIEKHEGSSLAEIQEALKGKTDDLKQTRKDKAKAQAEAKAKEKEFVKKEKLTQKSISILKQLEKAAQSKAEL